MALVGADEDLGAAVVDACLEGLGAEAAEHHHVDGAEARAGQQHDGELADHRQVDGDAVALLHAVLLEHVGEPADLVEKLLVRARRRVPGVALEDDGGLVTLAGLDVPVETVVARVELAALEPLDARRGLEAPLEHLVPRLGPHQCVCGALGPVPLGVLDGTLVRGLVLGLALEIGVLRELGRRWEKLSVRRPPCSPPMNHPLVRLLNRLSRAGARTVGRGGLVRGRRGTRISARRDQPAVCATSSLQRAPWSWTRRAGRRPRAPRSLGLANR